MKLSTGWPPPHSAVLECAQNPSKALAVARPLRSNGGRYAANKIEASMTNGSTDEGKIVVLVADDEPSTVAMVASHLRAKGYDVLEASDGDQAWQLAHENLPDLVVLDVMMPGMSGWEVCRKIREAVSLAHTGVVMLTGIGENLNEMTSPLYGADAHVDKPFEFARSRRGRRRDTRATARRRDRSRRRGRRRRRRG